jgi:hypothetical protein
VLLTVRASSSSSSSRQQASSECVVVCVCVWVGGGGREGLVGGREGEIGREAANRVAKDGRPRNWESPGVICTPCAGGGYVGDGNEMGGGKQTEDGSWAALDRLAGRRLMMGD